MEPYNKLNASYNSNFREELRGKMDHISYPTKHLLQKQYNREYNFRTFNNNPNSFKKTDIAQSGTFNETFRERPPERKQQLEHSLGWRQDNYLQRISTGNGAGDNSRIFDTDPSTSSGIDSERRRPNTSHPNILDIGYGYSRRSPNAGTNNNRTNRYESPERKQEYRDYDSQNNYYSRRSPNRDTRSPVVNYERKPSVYESRKDIQNKKSLTSNYRDDYEINRPLIYQSNTRDRNEDNYSVDPQRYSGGRNSNNKSLSNSGPNLQFSNKTSYDSQRLDVNKRFSDRPSRTSDKVFAFIDLTESRSEQSPQLTSLLDLNLRNYQSPNKNPINRFDQPESKSVCFPTSSVDHTLTQKRKQQVDESEIIAKRSRIHMPIANSIHKTNNTQVKKPFVKKSNFPNMRQSYNSSNIGEKSKPLTMAEEYIRKNSVRNPVNLSTENTFGRKSTSHSVMQPPRLPNVKEKNRPSTMAEEYLPHRSQIVKERNRTLTMAEEYLPPRLPNVKEKIRPLSMAEEYINQLDFQKFPVKNLKAPVENLVAPVKNLKTPVENLKAPVKIQKVPVKNQKAQVKSHPAPVKENVKKNIWEVLLVPKNFPFYRFTIEEIEELKIAVLGESEKHSFSVSCRKKARLLHFESDNIKDFNWVKNACKKCSPWKGIELKIIKVNYEPPHPVALYTKEFPNHAMTQEQLKKLTESLAAKMLESPNEKCIEIVELIRRRGKMIVYCNNEESLDWLMARRQDLELWEGGHLIISPALALPTYHICEVMLPKAHIDVNKAFARLDRQNDDLNTKTWFIITKIETPTEIKVLVSLGEDALKALEIVEFKPFLDFGKIEIILKGEMRKVKERFSLPK